MAKEMGEKQIFVITIVVFAAIFLVVGALIYVSYSNYSKITDDITRCDAETAKAKTEASGEKEKTAIRDELKKRVDDYNQYLPKTGEVERMLDSLASKCSEAGLKSKTLKLDTTVAAAKPGTKTTYETIRYKGEFVGTFHEIARFVSAIENWNTFKRFVNITEMSITAENRGLNMDDGRQKHTVRMTLEFYIYPEPKPAPAATTPAAGAAPATAGAQ